MFLDTLIQDCLSSWLGAPWLCAMSHWGHRGLGACRPPSPCTVTRHSPCASRLVTPATPLLSGCSNRLVSPNRNFTDHDKSSAQRPTWAAALSEIGDPATGHDAGPHPWWLGAEERVAGCSFWLAVRGLRQDWDPAARLTLRPLRRAAFRKAAMTRHSLMAQIQGVV